MTMSEKFSFMALVRRYTAVAALFLRLPRIREVAAAAGRMLCPERCGPRCPPDAGRCSGYGSVRVQGPGRREYA
jgi:hypothetical protein